MTPFMQGFADELTKLGASDVNVRVDPKKALRAAKRGRSKDDDSLLEQIRGEGRQTSRDYLASTLLGAAAFPIAGMAGSRITRGLRNRDVMRALKGARTPKERTRMIEKLETGPLIGSSAKEYKPGRAPTTTLPDIAGQATRGGLTGSVVQMLRDRFAGSAGVDD